MIEMVCLDDGNDDDGDNENDNREVDDGSDDDDDFFYYSYYFGVDDDDDDTTVAGHIPILFGLDHYVCKVWLTGSLPIFGKFLQLNTLVQDQYTRDVDWDPFIGSLVRMSHVLGVICMPYSVCML